MAPRWLMLMRHAKSSWEDPQLPDHDRPLNRRGTRDAPRMGQWLLASRNVPDLIVSSTARRALDTAQAVARACGYTGEIVVRHELYHASLEQALPIVRHLPDRAARVLLVGHNPGWEQWLAFWTGRGRKFPTAAIAVFQLSLASWQELVASTPATLEIFIRPKDLD